MNEFGELHVVEGVVVEGDHRGRELGFPTANIAESRDNPFPPDGVYAGRVLRADGSAHLAVISIGRRPTYHDASAPRVLEAHLLDFDDDLYGERLSVELGSFLRAQATFSSSEALIDQMSSDVAAARAANVT